MLVGYRHTERDFLANGEKMFTNQSVLRYIEIIFIEDFLYYIVDRKCIWDTALQQNKNIIMMIYIN